MTDTKIKYSSFINAVSEFGYSLVPLLALMPAGILFGYSFLEFVAAFVAVTVFTVALVVGRILVGLWIVAICYCLLLLMTSPQVALNIVICGAISLPLGWLIFNGIFFGLSRVRIFGKQRKGLNASILVFVFLAISSSYLMFAQSSKYIEVIFTVLLYCGIAIKGALEFDPSDRFHNGWLPNTGDVPKLKRVVVESSDKVISSGPPESFSWSLDENNHIVRYCDAFCSSK